MMATMFHVAVGVVLAAGVVWMAAIPVCGLWGGLIGPMLEWRKFLKEQESKSLWETAMPMEEMS